MSDLIKAIHESPLMFEIAVTGGGTSAISSLLSVAGASNSVLNAVIPYHANALTSYLGLNPAQSCSEETARLMASRAFMNGLVFGDDPENTIGLGATAALQTLRDRKGFDRIHVAIQSKHATKTYEQQLDKSQSREQQEAVCATFILEVLASQIGVSNIEPAREVIATPDWQELLIGSSLVTDKLDSVAVFPGAFNPPHDGHMTMAKIAEQQLGQKVAFEISILNVDKAPLDFIDMESRRSLLNDKTLVFTRAPTFLEKATLFPGCTFVVGIDTLVRIDDARYYNGSEQQKRDAIQQFAKGGHRFLVFGRQSDEGFKSLSTSNISKSLEELCEEVSEQTFRADVSSTELRHS